MADREAKPPLDGRIALVTGASRGIGRAVCRKFAAAGAHVIAVARDQAALESLDDEIRADGGAATLVPLDLRDHDSIDRMAEAVSGRFGRLDILVGNAGLLGVLGPLPHATDPTTWEDVMAVNVTANWRLIRAFDGLLRASDAGRVLFVTSGVTEAPRAYWNVYAVSKAALEMLALTYAAEMVKTPIRVNVIDPKKTRTSMRAAAYPGEDPTTVKSPDDVTEVFMTYAAPTCTRHGTVVRYGENVDET